MLPLSLVREGRSVSTVAQTSGFVGTLRPQATVIETATRSVRP